MSGLCAKPGGPSRSDLSSFTDLGPGEVVKFMLVAAIADNAQNIDGIIRDVYSRYKSRGKEFCSTLADCAREWHEMVQQAFDPHWSEDNRNGKNNMPPIEAAKKPRRKRKKRICPWVDFD